VARGKYDATEETDRAIVAQVAELSDRYAVPRAQIALAWLISKGCLPVVGVTKLSQLEDAAAAADVKLSERDAEALEEPYVPHRVVGAL
jgi:aryl-alcohol dehydrogenase-like predicted oxidoreductase